MTEARLFRDALGIPHLRAEDELALAFAQGRVTALDRAWQIEVDRWRAEHRLAAFLGPSGLPWDRFAARARIADTAQRAYAALDPKDQRWVDAYVEGVNAGLPQGRAASPELAALAALPGALPTHEPWPAWMPLGIFLVANTLASSFPNVLWRAHVQATAGVACLRRFEPDAASEGGSNAWALAGWVTSGGAPMLAGDPHRVIELPGVYQQIRLACDDYDVLGLAFPGVPGIAHFAHAGTVAWGVTSAVAHATQVFEERITGEGTALTALGPDGPEPIEALEILLAVRGAEPEPVRCIETQRGTIVDDAGRWSIRQPSRVLSDIGVGAMRRLLHARSAAEVAAALQGWVEPANRVLIADTEGAVLRGTAGRVPELPLASRWLPQRAAATEPAPWRAMPPFEPVATIAVDANERPRDRPAHDFGDGYPSAARAERIATLLHDLEPVDAAELPSVHGDPVSAQARALTERLLRQCAAAELDADARVLVAELTSWDGAMREDSRAAGVFAVWRSALVRRLAAHPALAPLSAAHGAGGVLAPWFDVASRIAMSLEGLLDAKELGIDGSAEMLAALRSIEDPPPTWGATHTLLPTHVLAGVAPAAVPEVPPVALAGDRDTVCAMASIPGVTDRVLLGSVARWVWDLADRERSGWNVPFGASGVPGPHFADQLDDWRAARTTPVVTDWSLLRPAPWG